MSAVAQVYWRDLVLDERFDIHAVPSTKAEASKAFKRLARKVHPDKGGTKELFNMLFCAHKNGCGEEGGEQENIPRFEATREVKKNRKQWIKEIKNVVNGHVNSFSLCVLRDGCVPTQFKGVYPRIVHGIEGFRRTGLFPDKSFNIWGTFGIIKTQLQDAMEIAVVARELYPDLAHWKAAFPTQLTPYWIKQPIPTHDPIKDAYTRVMQIPHQKMFAMSSTVQHLRENKKPNATQSKSVERKFSKFSSHFAIYASDTESARESGQPLKRKRKPTVMKDMVIPKKNKNKALRVHLHSNFNEGLFTAGQVYVHDNCGYAKPDSMRRAMLKFAEKGVLLITKRKNKKFFRMNPTPPKEKTKKKTRKRKRTNRFEPQDTTKALVIDVLQRTAKKQKTNSQPYTIAVLYQKTIRKFPMSKEVCEKTMDKICKVSGGFATFSISKRTKGCYILGKR